MHRGLGLPPGQVASKHCDLRGLPVVVAIQRREQFIMQLTIRDVTKFLEVSESTVTRWIKRRGMPAQYVSGQYRFNRAELLEWATANQIKVSLQMFDRMETDLQPAPTLHEALEAGGIFYRLHDTDKQGALRALVEVLPLPEGIDRELVLRLFLAREASASTAIGDGIAIPHVRNPIVLHVRDRRSRWHFWNDRSTSGRWTECPSMFCSR